MNEALARYRYGLFLLIALALVGAVGYGLAHRPPPVHFTVLPPQPTPLPTPKPTAAPVQCHVVGAVSAPGVYILSPGARVHDAVQAAGGYTADADQEGLNLAAVVQDQQQIIVPRRQAALTPGATKALEGPGNNRVNINTADSATLQGLPGIGPVMADRIITYRDQHGPFAVVDELIAIRGIGEATLERLRPLITTSP
jgi:competence protein ComEA